MIDLAEALALAEEASTSMECAAGVLVRAEGRWLAALELLTRRVRENLAGNAIRARENLAAETVAKVNALSARALEATAPHAFRPHFDPLHRLSCRLCGESEFHPLHQEPGGTP